MGPLHGVTVVELAGIGPGPFCGMLLADMGADVIRVERVGGVDAQDAASAKYDLANRNKRSIAINIKEKAGADVVMRLVKKADMLFEGFRPGVTERLGLGPEECLRANPRLVYGRMTGWGQKGPLAKAAGHDLNYISLSGALHAIGRKDQPPPPPLNLVGDLGGGALYLAFGMVAALFEMQRSGRGQVVDAAMVDGTASLMTTFHAAHQDGSWNDARGENLLDGGAPFYEAYRTKDGKFVAIAPLENQFYGELVARLGLDPSLLATQNDRTSWPRLRSIIAEKIATKTREEWRELLEGTDACFAPVLSLAEAASHPHHVARGTFVDVDGVVQPAPAPRFSRTPGDLRSPPPATGEHTESILADCGLNAADIARLKQSGVVRTLR